MAADRRSLSEFPEARPVFRSLLDRMLGNTQSAKLRLAAAYLDIGDKAAARKVLADIVAAGSAAERKQAEVLLVRIS
jgi:FimV-like protein